MLELSKLKNCGIRFVNALRSHRAIYTGLAICHGYGCVLTGRPELYGPMALLYALLALKG
jgi:hypothetical protein